MEGEDGWVQREGWMLIQQYNSLTNLKMSFRKTLNEPSSDRTENQYLLKLKGLFAKAVGEPTQERERRENREAKDGKPSKQQKSTKQGRNAQGVLMKQLSNFHDHYGNKIGELRLQIQTLKGTIKTLQEDARSKERCLHERSTQLEILSRENQQLLRILQSDKLSQKRNDKSDIHTFYQSLNESYKEKLAAVNTKHSREIEAISLKLNQLTREKEQALKSLEKVSAESSEMRLQLREYQIEKKYQNERMKNATLELNLRLRSQEEVIAKLRREHSKEVYVRNNSCRLSDIEKRDTMSDSAGGGILTSDPNCDTLLGGSILEQFKVTNKKIPNLGEWNSRELPMFTTEKDRENKDKDKEKQRRLKYKQPSSVSNCHKRNLSYHQGVCSSPRQQEQKLKTARDPKCKGNSELKIKVMRLEKMRRK